jgi:hypothetical protein
VVDLGRDLLVREVPVTPREKIMAHDRISGDHFFAESRDVCRESLLTYLKARQAQAIDTGTYRASIRTLSAFELEVLISDLEEAQPTTFMGHQHRKMRAGGPQEES